jgi:hypothetical protein
MVSTADEGKTLCRSITVLALSQSRQPWGEARLGSPDQAQLRTCSVRASSLLGVPLLMQQRANVVVGVIGAGRAKSTALAVTDSKADRDGPAHRQGPLEVITAQAKEAVIISVGRSQQLGVTVPGEPITDV